MNTGYQNHLGQNIWQDPCLSLHFFPQNRHMQNPVVSTPQKPICFTLTLLQPPHPATDHLVLPSVCSPSKFFSLSEVFLVKLITSPPPCSSLLPFFWIFLFMLHVFPWKILNNSMLAFLHTCCHTMPFLISYTSVSPFLAAPFGLSPVALNKEVTFVHVFRCCRHNTRTGVVLGIRTSAHPMFSFAFSFKLPLNYTIAFCNLCSWDWSGSHWSHLGSVHWLRRKLLDQVPGTLSSAIILPIIYKRNAGD